MLSTSQSESVKGFVTRVGSRITRGDVRLRLSSLESPLRFAVAGSALANQEENRDAEDFSVVLSQVAIVQELIDDCLSDIEPQSDQNNGMLDSRLSRTQLCALHRRLGEMRSTLNGEKNVKPWYLHSLSPQVGHRDNSFISRGLCLRKSLSWILTTRIIELRSASAIQLISALYDCRWGFGAESSDTSCRIRSLNLRDIISH